MDIKVYCLSLPKSSEDYPFGDEPAVIKVNKKIFAIFNNENEISLKCDPMQAIKDSYKAVVNTFPKKDRGVYLNLLEMLS
ncbi:MAG: YjbR [Clostridia bacterium]|nr:YjbR [Clostridia bacterium]